MLTLSCIKGANQASFSKSRDGFEDLVSTLESSKALSMTHDELESFLGKKGGGLIRQLLQDHLELRALREGREESIVGSDDVKRTHVRIHKRQLMTLWGSVEVERKAYGARGSSSLMPLDAELNLPAESFSLGVRKRVAFEAAKGSFDEVVESVRMTTLAKISKRQVEDLASRAAVDFDAYYAVKQQEEVGEPPFSPDSPEYLVLTTDGKGVVMRKEALRTQTRKTAENQNTKRTKDPLKRDKRNKKRMAQVASVYDVLPFVRRPEDVALDIKPVPEDLRKQTPPRPVNKRVWASVKKDKTTVITELFQEAKGRDPKKKRPWVALVDGDASQLDTIERCAKQISVELTIILDIMHVLFYLWGASSAFTHAESKESEAWVTKRLLLILQGKAAQVAAGMRRSATTRKLSKEARKPVDKCANYLLKYKEYMRYDTYEIINFYKHFAIFTNKFFHVRNIDVFSFHN